MESIPRNYVPREFREQLNKTLMQFDTRTLYEMCAAFAKGEEPADAQITAIMSLFDALKPPALRTLGLPMIPTEANTPLNDTSDQSDVAGSTSVDNHANNSSLHAAPLNDSLNTKETCLRNTLPRNTSLSNTFANVISQKSREFFARAHITPQNFSQHLSATDRDILQNLCISRDPDHWRNRSRPLRKGVEKVYDWIYQIDYHGDIDASGFPRVVFPLGHLVVQGNNRLGYQENETCTGSWFVLVMDLAKPEKSLWLVKDPFHVGWNPDGYYSDILSPIDPDDVSVRSDDQLLKHWDAREEPVPQEFFDRLAIGDVDLIRLCPLQEWVELKVGSLELYRYLFAEDRRFAAEPRLRNISKEELADGSILEYLHSTSDG